MALQARARIAPNGWRLPWGLRKSGISASTSISGRVCGTIGVAPAKCFGSCEGVPCHGSLTWGKTLYGSAPTSCQLLLRKLNDPAQVVIWQYNRPSWGKNSPQGQDGAGQRELPGCPRYAVQDGDDEGAMARFRDVAREYHRRTRQA